MNIIKRDLNRTERVMHNSKYANYSKIYRYSNEDLCQVFSGFDFNNQDILSVIGSGDQAFYFYDKGAKSVDLFDKNKLAIYHFYLRKWAITYLNDFLPNIFSNNYIKDLLQYVTPCDDNELNAYNYWSLYINRFKSYESDFLYITDPIEKDHLSNLDIDKVKLFLNKSINTYNFDLSKKINIEKKYDVIYISNILNYIYLFTKNYYRFQSNLNELLNEDGIIIATDFSKSEENYHLLRDYFLCEAIEMEYINKHTFFAADAYVYKRR